MLYVLEQKFISVGKDFLIKDEQGNTRYVADGYGFSIGKRFSLKDNKGQEIFDVKQKLGAFSPTYLIRQNKLVVAKVRRAIGAFRDIFYLTVTGSNEKIVIKGKLVEHEYRFLKNKNLVAEVSKKWFRQTDTYALQISDENLARYVISAAVVIDLVCHDQNSKHNRK